MRDLERWIWLNSYKYPNSQTTVYHHNSFPPDVIERRGNYTVAEFTRTYHFSKKVKSAVLRFSGDTEFDLWLNQKLVATGPVNVGGDFVYNDLCRNQHYATELMVKPESDILEFYARVKLMPVLLNEFSKGHGGFMLTAHVTFEDGTVTVLTTDRSWLVRKNGQYTKPFCFDGTIVPDSYMHAEEIQNIWHSQTSPLPNRVEEILYPNEEGIIEIPSGSKKEVVFQYDKVYGAFLLVNVKTKGLLKVSVHCFEIKEENSKEEFVFNEDTLYRGLQLHSVGGYRVVVDNQSDETAIVQVGAITTWCPTEECAQTTTSDSKLNKTLELCMHALKYCRQTIHLDSPKHNEPLACTGDYYIQTLMETFSFGDLTLAEFDVRRTAEILRSQSGNMFHTVFSLIWVLMLYDVYMFTGHKKLLEDCIDALILLLNRFEIYLGDNGLVENSKDYVFVDWLDVDGYSLHHPPKNLGQSCMTMFYYGALTYAPKIFNELDMDVMAEECSNKAEHLREAINKHLFNEERGLYCEGLSTPTPEERLHIDLPQSNGKTYYRRHANILATYFNICDKQTAKEILTKVMTDKTLGGCQPYFTHFLLEAVYRNGLREEYTMQILEEWKAELDKCNKAFPEVFLLPEDETLDFEDEKIKNDVFLNYTYDYSHAWIGSPLYALPKALLGFEMLQAGFAQIKLEPTLLGLDFATVEMLTPYGKIICKQDKNGTINLDVPNEISVIRTEE